MFRRLISLYIVVCFSFTFIDPVQNAFAGSLLDLPQPGTMVNLSPAYEPVIIKGLTVHKDNPFLFDFIVDVGQDNMSGEPLRKEGEKLIKYFLAGLAIPDKDVWVNLSPYEKNRMITESLGQTDMGRDLLEQDYMLKQITASLIYPEKQLGKVFWDKVYAKARQMYGTTQVPVNTFNKVWIVADRAEVFEHDQTAFVVDCHLKVMLEEDYLALKKHQVVRNDTDPIGANIVREIILPELEKEVNTGKNFANLRQIFNSIILSSWYKKNLKEALLNKVYADKARVKGIDLNDPNIKEQIYEQYLKAYKKGVFNYIKEDVDAAGSAIPRKYFSGGLSIVGTPAADPAMTTDEVALAGSLPDRALVSFKTGLDLNRQVDAAMNGMKRVIPDKIPGGNERVLMNGSFTQAKVVFPYVIGAGEQGEMRIEREAADRYFIPKGDELSAYVRIRNSKKGIYDFTFSISNDHFNLFVESYDKLLPVEFKIGGWTHRADPGVQRIINLPNGETVTIKFAGRIMVLIRRDSSLYLAEKYELDPSDIISLKDRGGRPLFDLSGRVSDAVGITDMSKGPQGQIKVFFQPVDLDPDYKIYFADTLAHKSIIGRNGLPLEEKDFLEMAGKMEKSREIFAGDYTRYFGTDSEIVRYVQASGLRIPVFVDAGDILNASGIRISGTTEFGQLKYYLFTQRDFLGYLAHLFEANNPNAHKIFLNLYSQVPDAAMASMVQVKDFGKIVKHMAGGRQTLMLLSERTIAFDHARIEFLDGNLEGELDLVRKQPGQYFIQRLELPGPVYFNGNYKGRKYGFIIGLRLNKFVLILDNNKGLLPVGFENNGMTGWANPGEFKMIDVPNGKTVKIKFAGQTAVLGHRDTGVFLETEHAINPWGSIVFKNSYGNNILQIYGRTFDAVGIKDLSKGQTQLFYQPLNGQKRADPAKADSAMSSAAGFGVVPGPNNMMIRKTLAAMGLKDYKFLEGVFGKERLPIDLEAKVGKTLLDAVASKAIEDHVLEQKLVSNLKGYFWITENDEQHILAKVLAASSLINYFVKQGRSTDYFLPLDDLHTASVNGFHLKEPGETIALAQIGLLNYYALKGIEDNKRSELQKLRKNLDNGKWPLDAKVVSVTGVLDYFAAHHFINDGIREVLFLKGLMQDKGLPVGIRITVASALFNYLSQNKRINVGPEKEILNKVYENPAKDSAMRSSVTPPPGGIDLNTSGSGMRWKVSRDGSGVEMDIEPVLLERIKREGISSLSPVIFQITPVVNVWSLLGLEAPFKNS